MIGIDIARIKRWFVKTYPAYSGTGYKTVITELEQVSIDSDHSLDGVELNFTVVAYDTTNNTAVSASSVSGRYSRRHYGGWQAYANS